MPTYTPAQIAQEVLNQGGSKAQAWVAAALVDGIESSGDTGAKNPSSTACGLFQFLTTTWASNGGTKYAPTACQASMQNQVTVFLAASAGSNFYPWAPDLGGSYNGNARQPAATTPQPGSPVANMISKLSSGGTMAFLGNVPTNWADAGAAQPGTPTPNPLSPGSGQFGSSASKPCRVGFTVPGTFGIGQVCLFSASQAKAVTGAIAIAVGAGLFTFGAVMLAAYGYDKSGAKQAVNSTARKIGVGTALLTGQPEVAAGLAATGGRGGSSSRQPRTAGLGPSPTPARPAQPAQAGRLESARIERQFRELQRQQGPIGPRGGNPTSARIAQRERRGTSVPGAQAARARQPF
jgi:hypothetical protein